MGGAPFFATAVTPEQTLGMRPAALSSPFAGGASLAAARCGCPGMSSMPMAMMEMQMIEMQLQQMMGVLMGLLMGLMTGRAPAFPGLAPLKGVKPHRPGGPVAGAPAGAVPSTGALGRDLKADALRHTTSVGGLCLKNVGAVLRRHGVQVGPAPAAADVESQLARSPKLREIQVSASDLKKLPAGAVVWWDRGSGLPYGHISISLGDGREWSGPIRNQMTLGTRFRVFVPRG